VSGTTILIVDDNADNREVYGPLLEFSGYTVLKAADGWAGIQQARAHHPDVILMDISIGVGHELCSEISESGQQSLHNPQHGAGIWTSS
jgi:CheY-like chemotaxis protein